MKKLAWLFVESQPAASVLFIKPAIFVNQVAIYKCMGNRAAEGYSGKWRPAAFIQQVICRDSPVREGINNNQVCKIPFADETAPVDTEGFCGGMAHSCQNLFGL